MTKKICIFVPLKCFVIIICEMEEDSFLWYTLKYFVSLVSGGFVILAIYHTVCANLLILVKKESQQHPYSIYSIFYFKQPYCNKRRSKWQLPLSPTSKIDDRLRKMEQSYWA